MQYMVFTGQDKADELSDKYGWVKENGFPHRCSEDEV